MDSQPYSPGIDTFNRSHQLVGSQYLNQPYYLKPIENQIAEEYELSSAGASDLFEKERELKQITDMRIKTLERIIKEKVQIIESQEGDVQNALRQNQSL